MLRLPMDASIISRFSNDLPSAVRKLLIDNKTRRDPVHDEVELNAIERAIVDTPEFQRLRLIKQMDFGYQLYPGAEHTRFTHSQGVCHVSKLLVDVINTNHERDRLLLGNPPSHDPGHQAVPEIRAWQRAVVGLAGLLHDIAHLPFSHAVENKCGLVPEHDRFDENPWLVEAMLGESPVGNMSWVLKNIVTPVLRRAFESASGQDAWDMDAASLLVEVLAYKDDGGPLGESEDASCKVLIPVPNCLRDLLLRLSHAVRSLDKKASDDARKAFRTVFGAHLGEKGGATKKLSDEILQNEEPTNEILKPLRALVHGRTSSEANGTADWRVIRWCFEGRRKAFESLLADSPRDDMEPLVLPVAHSRYFSPFMAELVGNTICADILDYVHRDYANLGLQRSVDLSFLRAMRIGSLQPSKTSPAPQKSDKHVFFRVYDRTFDYRIDVTSEIINLLEVRYILGERLFFHRFRLAQQELLGRCAAAYLAAKTPADGTIDEVSLRSIIRSQRLLREIPWEDKLSDRLGPSFHSDDSLLMEMERLERQQMLDRAENEPSSPSESQDNHVLYPRGRILRTRLYPFRPVGYINRRNPALRGTDKLVQQVIEVLCPGAAEGSGGNAFSRLRKQREAWHELRKIEDNLLPNNRHGIPEIRVFITCLAEKVHFKVPQVLVQMGKDENLVRLFGLTSEPKGLAAHIESLKQHYLELWKAVVFAAPEVVENWARDTSEGNPDNQSRELHHKDATKLLTDLQLAVTSAGGNPTIKWTPLTDGQSSWTPEFRRVEQAILSFPTSDIQSETIAKAAAKSRSLQLDQKRQLDKEKRKQLAGGKERQQDDSLLPPDPEPTLPLAHNDDDG